MYISYIYIFFGHDIDLVQIIKEITMYTYVNMYIIYQKTPFKSSKRMETQLWPYGCLKAASLLHLQALEYRQGTKFSKNQDPVIMNNEQKHTKTDQSGGYPILRNRHLQVVPIYSEDCSHQGTQIPKPYRTGFSAQCTFKPQSQS